MNNRGVELYGLCFKIQRFGVLNQKESPDENKRETCVRFASPPR